jgi:hypothetical protein
MASAAASAARDRSAATISVWSRRYSSRRAAEALRRFRSPHTLPCRARSTSVYNRTSSGLWVAAMIARCSALSHTSNSA